MTDTPAQSALPGMKFLLMGGTGSGKTTAIRTWIDAGITPFCIFTEPSFEVLGDIPSDKLHWRYIPPTSADWSTLLDTAKKINALSYDGLTKLSDVQKSKYNEWIRMIEVMNDFKCERTGQSFGCVDNWNTDRVLVVDSLSGLAIMAKNLMIGAKPTMSQPEYGVCMDNIERLVNRLTTGLRCHFMLCAHDEREPDEVSGGTKIMVSALGKKLAPKLPRFFSDVVLAKRDGIAFSWSTAAPNVDLKARNLPIAEGLKPSIVPLVESWKKRGGVIAPTL